MLTFKRTEVDITINGTTTTHKRNFLRRQKFEDAIYYAEEMGKKEARKD
tara:strand:- start:281 stop:427 length:147 start_codon:yes stop_codon:yes gene_type:complete